MEWAGFHYWYRLIGLLLVDSGRVSNSNASCEKHIYKERTAQIIVENTNSIWVFWYTLVTPTLKRWRQEDQQFNVIIKLHSKLDASQGYIKLSLKNENKNKNKT